MARLSVRWLPSLLLIPVLLFAACGGDEVAPTATPPPPTVAPTAAPTVATGSDADAATPTPELAAILDILTMNAGMERFAEVAATVGLAEQLAGAGPFTVFAPPTDAWDDLPAAVTADPTQMREILLNHVVEGQLLMTDMLTPGKVRTMLGNELAVMAGEEGGTIGGSNILGADFVADNGVIHVVDTVILPTALADAVMALIPTVTGEQTYPMQGNIHISNGKSSPVSYNSVPPTSGPHYPNIVAWQVYEEPFRYEQLVHNLEDSGVILYYQCETACPELLAELRAVAQPYIDGGRHLVVAPNDPTWTAPDGSTPHLDMGAPIVITAWRKSLKLDTVDVEKIAQFIDTYEGIDHHVK